MKKRDGLIFGLLLALALPVFSDNNHIYEQCPKGERPEDMLLARQDLETINPEGNEVFVNSEVTIKRSDNGVRNSVNSFEVRSTNLIDNKIRENDRGCLVINRVVTN